MKTKIYRAIIYLLKASLSNSQIGTNKFLKRHEHAYLSVQHGCCFIVV